MRTLLIPVLFSALAVTPDDLRAQSASFKTFAAPCPSTTGTLGIRGVPRLGTTFTVSGIRFPYGCTFRFCGCNPGPCNSCTGSLLVVGVNKISAPLPPAGCALRVSTEAILAGTGSTGDVAIAVPNSAVLSGFQFHLQRADVSMIQTVQANCQLTYPLRGFRGWSNAVTGTVGR